MAKTKAELPKILTANDLLNGRTVYYTAAGAWSPYVADAMVVSTPEEKSALEKAGADAFAANRVLDVALVDVKPNGTLQPAHIREVIRSTGPTVRRDLNKPVSPSK
ncbi:MAG: DUF2849 domain-containing protein [Rhodospirillaceae bacterium]